MRGKPGGCQFGRKSLSPVNSSGSGSGACISPQSGYQVCVNSKRQVRVSLGRPSRTPPSDCVRMSDVSHRAAMTSDVPLAISLFVDAKSVRRGYGSGSSSGSSEPKPGPRVTRRRRERDLPAFSVFHVFRKDLRQVRALPPISPVRRRQSGVRVRPSGSGSDPRVFGAKLSLSLVTGSRRVTAL